MSTAVAPDGRRITFLLPDGSGHSTLELGPAAAALKFGELRGQGYALFDVSGAEHTLVVGDIAGGESLPDRMLAYQAYEGG